MRAVLTAKEAIREMRDGGYGFHELWQNLPAWIDGLQVDGLPNPKTAE
jgi:hypothetical protein